MANANSLLIRALVVGGVLLSALMPAACGKGNGAAGNFPSDFENRTDAEKMAYVMKGATPDSVARFLCDASLGRIPNVSIKSFSEASNYVYSTYKDADVVTFTEELENYPNTLPLADRMRIYKDAGKEDPQRLGYVLGLDYMRMIRENNMTAEQVETELKEFRKACGPDKETYDRFIVGFHTVLKLDHGKDIPEEIYNRFINYQ